MDKYSWSFDGDAEYWYEGADSIAECLADARAAVENGEHGPTDTVYIGENAPFIPRVDAESVLEEVEQDAYEFCELGGDWCACDNRAKDEMEELTETLSTAVIAWLKKYGRDPNFYAVQNVKPYPLYPETEAHDGS